MVDEDVDIPITGEVMQNGLQVLLDEDGLITGQVSASTTWEPNVWTPAHRLVLRLRASGKPTDEIADETGFSEAMVRKLCNSPTGKAYIEAVYQDLDAEFKAMYGEVVSTTRKWIKCADPQISLTAINLWSKINGKFTQKVEVKVTAEDVVRKLVQEDASVAANASAERDRNAVHDTE